MHLRAENKPLTVSEPMGRFDSANSKQRFYLRSAFLTGHRQALSDVRKDVKLTKAPRLFGCNVFRMEI
jgi:hypothetical protein